MIFRDKDGNLLNINRKSYYTESEYYNKLLDLKGYRILDLVDEYNTDNLIFEKMNELMRGTISSN